MKTISDAHILIVEDSLTQAEQLKYILVNAGYQVSVAHSGEQALEMLSTMTADMVITDIMMPGISGYELCQKIKVQWPALPVVLLTTRSDPMDIFYGLEAGADNFHTKPFNEDNLLDRISFILHNRRLKQQGKLKVGLEVAFFGKIFTINSEKEQILDLLIAAFEDTVNANKALESHREQLAQANKIIESYARKLESKVRSSEENYSAIVNGISEGIITLNSDAVVESVNPAAEQIFGRCGTDLIGEPFSLLLDAESIGVFKENFNRCQSIQLQLPPFTLKGIQSDIVIPVNLRLNRILVNEHEAFVVIVRDLTKELQAEEKLRHAQKMEAIGQLTGGIAHDFNNLLSIVIGNTELLTESISDQPEQLASVKSILVAAERGADLTARLLAFARRQPLNNQSTSIVDSINRLHSLLARTLGENITIQIRHSDKLWTAQVDPNQLENCLLNLAINARDAMSDGGVLTIENDNVVVDEELASRDVELNPGEYVVITVSDTGCGISPANLTKIFEPFFTTKDIGKGSGLGLSMVYGFVKQSQGHIKIYSEIGVGTSFKLYFPRSTSQVKNNPVQMPAEATPSGHEHILVVEDDDLVRQMVVVLLESLGYQVTAVGNAQEALQTLNTKGEIDLVFTDIVMPGGMSGIELANKAKQLYPHLPVLLTSGYAESAAKSGNNLPSNTRLISKPYRRLSLAITLRDIFDNQ